MKILKEIEIGGIHLRNRVVYPPMATSKASHEGLVTEEIIEFYRGITRDKNLGMVIVEHCYISNEGKAGSNQMSISKDEDVEGLKRLVDMIKKSGSKAILQINHAGSAANREVTGCEVIGPSSIANPRKGNIPKELSKKEVKNLIQKYVDAARRGVLAGFDGVEIHSAHGYMLNQFFSPLTNRREDEFGGSLKGRIKVHLEVIDGVKKVLKDDMILLLRLGASDYEKGGATIDDSILAIKEFAERGVQIIDISGGFCGYTNPNNTKQGYFSELTEKIKKNVEVPVILTGGINDVKVANSFLECGKADLIGIGRAIFKDNSWLKKQLDTLGNL